MVHIHCAYTEAINPAGSEPVLSRDQVGYSRSLYLCGEMCSPLCMGHDKVAFADYMF